VTLNVNVIDHRGSAVLGLDKKDFSITDNRVPQEIMFFSDADEPVSVGIVFDVSGSMTGKKFERAKEALSNFIQSSHPNDEYSLIGFNSQPQLLLDKSRDGDAVIKKLSYVEPHGSTALYVATYMALERVSRGVYAKRAIVIISDGEDNSSRYTFSELRRALKESGVTVYAIGIEGTGGDRMLEASGKLWLGELASVSGGKAFFPHHANSMYEAFEQIALELRHQYSIGYRPPNFKSDGTWHRLKVKVTPPPDSKRIFVRSREGYYAVASSP
jgi:Ca-activated chloride channel family protein